MSVIAALHMAKDEFKQVKALDAACLATHRNCLHAYYALKDDWVGKEKEGVIEALGGPSSRIVEDAGEVPHAFCIVDRTRCSYRVSGISDIDNA